MCNPDTMPRVAGSSGLARALLLCLRSKRECREVRERYDAELADALGKLCDCDDGETYHGEKDYHGHGGWTVTLY